MPAKTFRYNRPDSFLVRAGAPVKKGALVRFEGISGIEREQLAVPADADYTGPLYIAQADKRAGTNVFVCRYGEVIHATIEGLTGKEPDGTVLFLADGGKLALDGIRPVGTLANHPSKGPIALLEPGQCGALVPELLVLVAELREKAEAPCSCDACKPKPKRARKAAAPEE